MVTIDESDGFRIVIYTNDHAPAHVHAINSDGEAKINLDGADGAPELIWVVGMKRSSIRKVMRLVKANSTAYLEEWRKIHG